MKVLWRFFAVIGMLLFLVMIITGTISYIQSTIVSALMTSEAQSQTNDSFFTGEYTEELPLFDEIKGHGEISDEIAQLAVGTAVKYRLLPSVILSQFAYESEWGKSQSARSDSNFFGITWFNGCPFPKGSSRGIGGSEGGNYMRFPSKKACFSYYGYMVATQTNFNACVGNKSPSECLLILGRGGYAAAGIGLNSAYYTACMQIIETNQLTQYDTFAINKWETYNDSFLTGNKVSSEKIVAIAQKEINSGSQNDGTKYWSWYGFNNRVEWCACFVSWSANEAGLITSNQVPKHASCAMGVSWFSEKGQYQPARNGYKPKAGDIIYFDWAGGQTGKDHVGIVEQSDGNTVQTIEGNVSNQLMRKSYSITDQAISGYGLTK